MAAKCKYVVIFHFDGNFGLNYKDTPDRRKRTVRHHEWWEQRASIMKKYVIPSLKNQKFKNFDVWGLFMRGFEQQSKPVRKLFDAEGYHTTFDGPAEIRSTYYGWDDIEWLGLIHHDSDDLYSEDAFKLYSKVEPAEGRIAYYHRGLVYGCSDSRLFTFGYKSSPPLAFHMTFYPKWALRSEPHWYGYRRVSGVATDHFQIHKTKRSVQLPNGNFCQLIHGKNTVTAWKNPNVKKRLGRKVEGKERQKIMARFGVKL